MNSIIQFYDKLDSEFFEDILLEFFDGKPYDYKIKIGLYLKNHYSYNRPSSMYLSDDYNTKDKEVYLFTFIMSSIMECNKSEQKIRDEKREERKKSRNWLANTRSRGSNSVNFFKYINNINPCLHVDIRHRECDNYDEFHLPNFRDGITIDEFLYQIPEKIKKRLSFIPQIGDNTSISVVGYPWIRNFYEEEEEGTKRIEGPVLHGEYEIKFFNNRRY